MTEPHARPEPARRRAQRRALLRHVRPHRRAAVHRRRLVTQPRQRSRPSHAERRIHQAELMALTLLAAVLYSSVGQGGNERLLGGDGTRRRCVRRNAPRRARPEHTRFGNCGRRFARAGCFSWRLSLLFAIASVPLAFVGRMVTLPGALYKQMSSCFTNWVEKEWSNLGCLGCEDTSKDSPISDHVASLSCGDRD
ncbi:MAG: hypothetical protein H0T92_13050 [Pyrinomonadaceae bacterium]|nr:hypothetical protein [Pyrinomonadaceae bacterium]